MEFAAGRPADWSDDDNSEDEEMDIYMPTVSVASTANAGSNVSSNNAGMGRGRGRGLLINHPESVEVHTQNSTNWSFQGRGRGRRRRRSSSGSPNPSSGTERKKTKEGLLERVPEFGTGLRGEGWAKELLKNLKVTWEADHKRADKQFSKALQHAFQKCLEMNYNVPSLAVFFVLNAVDFLATQGGKPQAAAFCMGVHKFISVSSPTPLISCSPSLLNLVLDTAIFQRKESLLKTLLSSFGVTKLIHSLPGLHSHVLSVIKSLLEQHEYTEACQCATFLEIHSSFTIHDFLVPLILQDKPALVEDFLQGSPTHQHELVLFLDSQFQDGSGGVTTNLLRYKQEHCVPETKEDKFSPKPITKLIKRLKNKYSLGFDSCPHIGRRQRYGELRHMFGRCYEKMEMNSESFAEYIDQFSQEGLKQEILDLFYEYRDFQNAAAFITRQEMFDCAECEYPDILKYLPQHVKLMIEEREKQRKSVAEECWDDEGEPLNISPNPTHQGSDSSSLAEELEKPVIQTQCNQDWDDEWESNVAKPKVSKVYFRHPLDRNSVLMLEDATQVLTMCDELKDRKEGWTFLSGFDAEWKPILSSTAGAALLQLAFESRIYLVDVVSLKKNCKSDEVPCPWTALRKHYFENENILKLGFDLRNDVKMLMETVPQWRGMSSSWRQMLDLSSLKSLILKQCPHLFDRNDFSIIERESGLSELVYLCTKKSLGKEEQMSDWEKRPLRKSQILYAASDAYCLISVYRKLEELCRDKNVDFQKIQQNYLKGCTSQPTNGESSKKKKGSVEMIFELLDNIPPPGENKKDSGKVALVVDSMLLGLGRYLRYLGFDTLYMKNDKEESCDKYAKEGRVVITRGFAAYSRCLRDLELENVDQNMVYNVRSETSAAQLEEICNYFGVTINGSRLFTICFRCNSSEFVTVSIPKIYQWMEAANCHIPRKSSSFASRDPEIIASLRSKSFEDQVIFTSPDEQAKKSWTLLPETSLKTSVELGKFVVRTSRNVPVEVTRLQLTAPVLDQVFICNHCGKCFWSSKSLQAHSGDLRYW